jgi:hypothetical protein
MREIVVQIEPPVQRDGGAIKKLVIPKWPCPPGREAETREEVVRMLVLDFGTGALTGDLDTGWTFRPD